MRRAARAGWWGERDEGDARRLGVEGRRALALLLLFAGFYLLTGSGHFYTGDEETLYLVTERIVEGRTLTLPAGTWGVHLRRAQGADGALYSQYPPVQSLAAVPLYLLGRAAAAFFPDWAAGYITRFAVAALGALVAAATVATLYRLARALGYRERAALGLAAIYGLATMAWPSSRTFFAEPLTALTLLAAFYALGRGTAARPARGWLVAAGAAATVACATKPHAVIAVPILGLYLLARAGAAGGERRARAAGMLRAVLWWCAGLALAAIPYGAYNAILFGGPFRTGYGGSSVDLTFDTPFSRGLYGLTLSSGKGLLWYAPPVLLALVGARAFYRRGRAEALACLGIVAAHLLFYSRLHLWAGDGSWGPRYLGIMLPFAILPLVALLDGLDASPWRRAGRALVGGVVALGVAVQLLGVLVNFNWYLPHYPDDVRYFRPAASPIVGHAHLLALRAAEWWSRAFPPREGAVLTGGFGPPEGDPVGDEKPPFPRWTTGAGEITLYAAAGTAPAMKLTFFDHRPAALRVGQPTPEVLIDDAPLPDAAIERRDFSGTGQGWTYQFVVPAASFADGRARVTLRSATWNPRAAGLGERDETLGVYVHGAEVYGAGRPWPLREALPIGRIPADPGPRDRWFSNDGVRHHPADLWPWFVAKAGLGRARALALIAVYGAVGVVPFVAGWRGLARSAPAGGWWRLPARRPRRGHRGVRRSKPVGRAV